MTRHVTVHVCTGRNKHIIAHSYATNDRSVNTNPYTIAYNGRTLTLTTVLLTNRYTLMQVTI